MSTETLERARSHGERRRAGILAAARDLSSAEGLAGLSIGGLAAATGMSKSGLFAHFGSKQELQLATVEYAAAIFERDVIAPARRAEPGLARLRALLAHWVTHIETTTNRGGCFFAAASAEFSSRPGPVRDRLARLSRGWRDQLREEAHTARRCGELAEDADPSLLAFQLHAYVEEANWSRELLDERESFEVACAAVAATLAAALPRPNHPEKGAPA